MVDASLLLTPPFSLYELENSQFAIRRPNCGILNINGGQRQTSVVEDSYHESSKLQSSTPTPIFGIFGHMELPSGPYLILISRTTVVGQLMKCNIYRVEELKFVYVGKSRGSKDVPPQDKSFIDMV